MQAAEVAAMVEVAGGTVNRAAGERAVAEAEHRLREAQAALREAASERKTIEAARAAAEAGRAAAEAECRGLEAALVQLMARTEQESQGRSAAGGMRRLVVVEAEPRDVDAATQTETAAEVSVSSQTGSELAAVQVCKMQAAGCEMVVGRQLHPAQAEAVERAERAAEQLERLREQAEAAAARYRVTGGVADAQAAEVSAQKAAQVTTPTGGRQRRRAQLRRQAAAAGVDVLSWTVGRRRQQEEAEVVSRSEVQQVLEQRLEAAHEQWLRRQKCSLAADAYVGEAEASRRFWQAAQASGINLLDAPD